MADIPILRAPLTFKVHLQVSRKDYMPTERLLQEIVMASFFIFLGALLLLATRQRWRFVDPPDSWWWFSSQAMVKKLFGSRFAIALSYFVAVGFIVVGAIAMTGRLMTLCQRMGYCE